MALNRIEFHVSDPELRVLAAFAVRNEGTIKRPDNWQQARRELEAIGWRHDHAEELLHSFAKQLDTEHAREWREKKHVGWGWLAASPNVKDIDLVRHEFGYVDPLILLIEQKVADSVVKRA